MVWTREHCGLAAITFLRNGRSVIATQRATRLCFNIPRNVSVPDGKTIRRWVRALEETGFQWRTCGTKNDPQKCFTGTAGFTSMPHGIGRPRTATTSENVGASEDSRRTSRREALCSEARNCIGFA